MSVIADYLMLVLSIMFLAQDCNFAVSGVRSTKFCSQSCVDNFCKSIFQLLRSLRNLVLCVSVDVFFN